MDCFLAENLLEKFCQSPKIISGHKKAVTLDIPKIEVWHTA